MAMALISASATALSQIVTQHGSESILAIQSLGADSYIAGGRNGTLTKSFDRGLTWVSSPTLPFAAGTIHRHISFADSTHGWISSGGRIAETTDGGLTYTERVVPGSGLITDVAYNDWDQSYIVQGGALYRQRTGWGWSQQLFAGQPMTALECVASEPLFGWTAVAGSNGLVYTKGGDAADWFDQSLHGTNAIDVHVIDILRAENQNYIVAASKSGEIAFNSNSVGNGWRISSIYSVDSIYDVKLVGPDRYYVATSNGVWFTNNGGQSYARLTAAHVGVVRKVHLDESGLIGVGDNGLILTLPFPDVQWPSLSVFMTPGRLSHDNGCLDITSNAIDLFVRYNQWQERDRMTSFELQVRDAIADSLVKSFIRPPLTTRIDTQLYEAWQFDEVSFRVRALRGRDVGPWSDVIRETLEPVGYDCPFPPVIVEAGEGGVQQNSCANTTDSVVLFARWTSVTRSQGYRVTVSGKPGDEILFSKDLLPRDTSFTASIGGPINVDSVKYVVEWLEDNATGEGFGSSMLSVQTQDGSCLPVQPPTACVQLVNDQLLHPLDSIRWRRDPHAERYVVSIEYPKGVHYFDTFTADTAVFFHVSWPPNDSIFVSVRALYSGVSGPTCDAKVLFTAIANDCWDLSIDSLKIISATPTDDSTGLRGLYSLVVTNTGDIPLPDLGHDGYTAQALRSATSNLRIRLGSGAGASRHSLAGLLPGQSRRISYPYNMRDTSRYRYLLVSLRAQDGNGGQCSWANDTLRLPVSGVCLSDAAAHNYAEAGFPAACKTCTDGIRNGDEEGVDCGGSTCISCFDRPAQGCGELVTVDRILPFDTIRWRSLAGAERYLVRVFHPTWRQLGAVMTADTTYEFSSGWPPNDSIYVTITPFNSHGTAMQCDAKAYATGAVAPCWDISIDSLAIMYASVSDDGSGLKGRYQYKVTNVGQDSLPAFYYTMQAWRSPDSVLRTLVNAGASGSRISLRLAPGESRIIANNFLVKDTATYKYLLVSLVSQELNGGQCSWANDTLRLPIRMVCLSDTAAHNYAPVGFPSSVCETCDDDLRNGDETAIDCGGLVCAPCGACPNLDSGSLLEFTTQHQIDSFITLYPSCAELPVLLKFRGNSIVDLSGFGSLKRVQGLIVEGCHALPNLDGLQAIRSLPRGLWIKYNGTLHDISSLDGVTGVSRVSMSGNALLNALPNLVMKDSIDEVFLSHMPLVTNLHPLGDVKQIQFLTLRSMSGLSSLDGLDSLYSCSRIEISQCISLYDISSLRGLDPVTPTLVTIQDNPVLGACSEAWLCAVVDQASANFSISGNAQGCDSYEDLLHGCGLNDPSVSSSWMLWGGWDGSAAGTAVSITADGDRFALSSPEDAASTVRSGAVTVYSRFGGPVGGSVRGRSGAEQFGAAISLSADGNRLAVGAPATDSTQSLMGRVQVYEHLPIGWTPLGPELSGVQIASGFGSAIAFSRSGSRLFVGIPRQMTPSGIGEVAIYDWNGSIWQQTGSIAGIGPEKFGNSLSVSYDGMTVVVGAPDNRELTYGGGAVRVYSSDGTSWGQVGNTIFGDHQWGHFGTSVAIDSIATRMVIGQPSYDLSRIYGSKYSHGSGRAQIYNWNGAEWSQLGSDLVPLTPYGNVDRFGAQVAISSAGDRASVSADWAHLQLNQAGLVRNYDFRRGEWSPSTVAINGRQPFERLGSSLALSADGRTLVVGAPGFDTVGATNAGRMILYHLPPLDTLTTPNATATTLASSPITSPFPSARGWGGYQSSTFGARVALDQSGCRMLVSHPTAALGAGGVAMYRRGDNGWELDGDVKLGTGTGSHVGSIIAIAGNGLRYAYAKRAVADPLDSMLTVHVMAWDGTLWAPLGQALTAQASDTSLTSFGESLGLDLTGERLIIGSPGDDENGRNSGKVTIYELVDDAWQSMGPQIKGFAANQRLGYSAAIDLNGETLAIGAPGFSVASPNAGAIKVYRYNGAAWNDAGGFITASATDSLFGSVISMSGDGSLLVATTLLRGQPGVSTSVKTFDLNVLSFSGTPSSLLSPHAGSGFGESLTLSDDGTRFAVSIPGLSAAPTSTAQSQYAIGRVALYERTGSVWRPLQQSPAGATASTQLGVAVALSGNGEHLAAGTGAGVLQTFEVTDAALGQVVEVCPAEVSATARLSGLLSVDGQMSDWLRAGGQLPAAEPLTAQGAQVDNAGATLAQKGRMLVKTGASAPVDWICLELRDANQVANVAYSFVGILTREGAILDAESGGPVRLTGVTPGQYYLAVQHRNHLGVRSSVPVTVNSGGLSFDFTDATQLYGTNVLLEVGGYGGLIPGDANGDGTVNAVDLNASWRVQNGQQFSYPTGSADFNGDGTVNAVDLNSFWRPNNSRSDQGLRD